MKKKILAIFLTCAMLISLVSVPVFADEVHVHTDCAHTHYTDTPLSGQTMPTTCKETAIVHRICDDCEADLGYKQISGEHQFETEFKDATCDSPAMAGEVCQVCGATNGDMTVVEGSEALDHDMKLDTTNEKYVAATCERGGLDTLKCSRCDHTEEKTTEALGHAWVDGDVVEAGCENAAGVNQTCSNCNAERVLEFVDEGVATPALKHDWDEGVVTAPTCKAKGYTTYTCKRCGKTEKRAETEMLAHTWDEGVVTAPTCKAEGYTTHTCEMCGDHMVDSKTDVDPNNHLAKLVKILKNASCTEDGIGKYECEHCKADLGYKVIPGGHVWDEGKITTPATCDKDGVKTYTCTCGETMEEVITDRPEHDYQEAYVDATCTSPAMVGEVCTACKAVKGEMKPVDNSNALGHDMKLDTTNEKYKPASCEEGGLDTLKCSRCDHTEEKTTEALGHAWVDGDFREATCTEAAGVNQTCSSCKAERVLVLTSEGQETVPALGHDWDEGVVTAPTCKAKGYTTDTCKRCGETETYNETEMLTHEWDEGVVTAPTCNAEGYTTHTCVMCGDHMVDSKTEADQNNHVAKLVKVLKEASCTATGIGKYECEHCKTDLGYKVIKVEHAWNDTPYVSENNTTVYVTCKKCDAAKIIAYFGDQDIEAGYVIPSLNIDADMTVSGAVDTNVVLTVQVAGDLSLYDSFWLEINGVKVSEYTESNGVYTFVYNTNVKNMVDTFVVVLKADVAGVICSGEAVTYNFELLEGSYSTDSVATDKIANATASFAGRGVLIGETVRLLYHIKASETDVLVLKKYGTDEVFATVKVSDMKYENGVYVAEIVVSADDWDQIFSASICDSEGNVISNTNHYSVAQYASKNITDDTNNKLSNILRAMMKYIAD